MNFSTIEILPPDPMSVQYQFKLNNQTYTIVDGMTGQHWITFNYDGQTGLTGETGTTGSTGPVINGTHGGAIWNSSPPAIMMDDTIYTIFNNSGESVHLGVFKDDNVIKYIPSLNGTTHYYTSNFGNPSSNDITLDPPLINKTIQISGTLQNNPMGNLNFTVTGQTGSFDIPYSLLSNGNGTSSFSIQPTLIFIFEETGIVPGYSNNISGGENGVSFPPPAKLNFSVCYEIINSMVVPPNINIVPPDSIKVQLNVIYNLFSGYNVGLPKDSTKWLTVLPGFTGTTDGSTGTTAGIGQTGIDFSNEPCCIHPDSLVETNKGLIPIRMIKNGDIIKDCFGNWVDVIYNIRYSTPISEFISFQPNSLKEGSPDKELLLTIGHPILYKNNEVEPRNIENGIDILYTNIKPVFVYSLCTRDRIFVMINNAPVCTWPQEGWESIEREGWVKQ